MTVARTILAVAISVLLAGVGYAEGNGETWTRSGGYLGLSFAYGIENFDIGDDTANIVRLKSDFGDSPGFRAYGGYRFNKFVSVDASVDWYSSFSHSFLPDEGGGSLCAQLLTFMVGGKFYPLFTEILEGRLQPYVFGGLGLIHARTTDEGQFEGEPPFRFTGDDTQFAMRFTGGADFWVTDNFGVNVDVGYVVDPVEMSLGVFDARADFAPVTIGVQYRFPTF